MFGQVKFNRPVISIHRMVHFRIWAVICPGDCLPRQKNMHNCPCGKSGRIGHTRMLKISAKLSCDPNR